VQKWNALRIVKCFKNIVYIVIHTCIYRYPSVFVLTSTGKTRIDWVWVFPYFKSIFKIEVPKYNTYIIREWDGERIREFNQVWVVILFFIPVKDWDRFDDGERKIRVLCCPIAKPKLEGTIKKWVMLNSARVH
jgi:hypothetical protein